MVTATPLTPSLSTQNPNSGEENELSNFQVLGIASAIGAVLSVVIFITASLLLYWYKTRHRQQRDSHYVPLATREDSGIHAAESVESSTTSEPNEAGRFFLKDVLESSTASEPNEAGSLFFEDVFVDRRSNSIAPEGSEEAEQRDSGCSLALATSPSGQETTKEDSESMEVHHKHGSASEVLYWKPANREDELRAQLSDLHLPEVQRREIEVYEELGSGRFGIVYRGVWLNSEQESMMEVALKCLLTCSRKEERVKFLQEAAILGQFKHPNVVRISGMVTTTEPLMILCEVMHKGDLHHYLKSLRTSSDRPSPTKLAALLLSFCQQVASGMAYLAYKLYVHGNLEGRNILVSRDDVCKITHFGTSRSFQDEQYSVTYKVRIRWMAPEVLTSQEYSTASDVWSCGILLYEIWTLGVKPYHTFTSSETKQKVLAGYRLPLPSDCPQSIYQLMLSCWNHEVESRPAFSRITFLLQSSNLLDQQP